MINVDETKLESYDSRIKQINTAMTNLYNYHAELETILASGKWEGDAHDITSTVVQTVKSYYESFIVDYDAMKLNVLNLVKNVDDFHNNSASVQNIAE